MSYTPTEWETGDIVSSQRLNKLEEGVKDAYEMLNVGNVTIDLGSITGTLDKTWQEIFDAVSAGNICYFTGSIQDDEYSKKIFIITDLYRYEGEEIQYCISTVGEYELRADSPTQRPAAGGGGGGPE